MWNGECGVWNIYHSSFLISHSYQRSVVAIAAQKHIAACFAESLGQIFFMLRDTAWIGTSYVMGIELSRHRCSVNIFQHGHDQCHSCIHSVNRLYKIFCSGIVVHIFFDFIHSRQRVQNLQITLCISQFFPVKYENAFLLLLSKNSPKYIFPL